MKFTKEELKVFQEDNPFASFSYEELQEMQKDWDYYIKNGFFPLSDLNVIYRQFCSCHFHGANIVQLMRKMYIKALKIKEWERDKNK